MLTPVRCSPEEFFLADWNMNLYRGCSHGCIYCDSRSACYQVADFDRVQPKADALGVLEAELRSKRRTGIITMGAMSDPYNPLEAQLGLTRGALALYLRYGFGAAYTTKAPLCARDASLLAEIGRRSPVCARLTVTCADDGLCRRIEPHVAPTSARLAALRTLTDAGVYAGVWINPVLPFLTDTADNLIALLRQSAEAGAQFAYGILGGIPCYLQRFSDKRTIAENIQQEILRTGSFLKDEPQLLLKMELREPAVYNSIFEAIAGGASRMNDIAQKIKEDSGKCSRYIATLKEIRLLDRITPCGEDESTKRTVYQITDNFYTFWYRYIFANRSYYELLGEEDAAQEITSDLSNLMGAVFERVCQQYMVRMAKARRLPFVPFKMGKWWGNNPVKRRQDDIDILALDRTGSRAIFCECKFCNELFDMQEYRDFMDACVIFTQVKEPHYYLFVKSGYTKDVQKQAAVDGAKLLIIDDLFSIEQ